MFSMGVLSNVLVSFGGPGSVKRFDVQFRASPGPTIRHLHRQGHRQARGRRAEAGRRRIQCETKPGTKSIIGSATLAL